MKDKLISWISNNRKEFWLLVAILSISAVLRLWQIDEYLPFMGDEGRDVRIVRRFLTDLDLMFVGPRTSIGDMYLGPAYYYLIAPFLLLFNFSPVGPAVFVALTSVATVFLVWWASREWFGQIAAFSAALLYAVSPVVISFSRHSWNPNIMPFFAFLAVYAIWRVWRYYRFVWLLIVGFSAAVVLQSHYLSLLLFPVLAAIWFITLVSVRKQRKTLLPFLRYSLFSILLFAFLMSPLVLFESKHGWHNANAMKKFFFERQTTVSANPWNALPAFWPLWQERLITTLLTFKHWFGGVLAGLLLLFTFWLDLDYFKRKKFGRIVALGVLFAWIFVGLVGIGLLKQNVYDHYFGFLFPAPFLVLGAVMQGLWEKNLKWLVIPGMVFLLWLQVSQNSLQFPPQRQMQKVQEIDRQVIQDSSGKPFNFALIAQRNYEEGYLYFFELWGAQVREIDPSNTKETLTDQLYVVCEDPVCEPINHRKAEIANFGWAKVEKQWEARGTEVYKLVHTQQK